jgi:hypothetical protein
VSATLSFFSAFYICSLSAAPGTDFFHYSAPSRCSFSPSPPLNGPVRPSPFALRPSIPLFPDPLVQREYRSRAWERCCGDAFRTFFLPFFLSFFLSFFLPSFSALLCAFSLLLFFSFSFLFLDR